MSDREQVHIPGMVVDYFKYVEGRDHKIAPSHLNETFYKLRQRRLDSEGSIGEYAVEFLVSIEYIVEDDEDWPGFTTVAFNFVDANASRQTEMEHLVPSLVFQPDGLFVDSRSVKTSPDQPTEAGYLLRTGLNDVLFRLHVRL